MNKFIVFIKAMAEVKNWAAYLADYFKLVKGRISYTLRDGSIYALRAGTNDRNIFNEVMFHKLYNPLGFEINKGDVVMDIGAHIGMFSVLASKEAKKIYSFEPFSENFNLLSENVLMNKRENIIAINKAVSSQSEEKWLYINRENKGGHSFYSGFRKVDDKILVKTISLAEFFSQYNIEKVDLLKMDCEGGEYDILFTCPRNILDAIGKISMEYHNIDDDHNVAKLENFLKASGFQVTVLNNIHMLYAKKK